MRELLSPWGWGVWVCSLRTLATEILMDTSPRRQHEPQFQPFSPLKRMGAGLKVPSL